MSASRRPTCGWLDTVLSIFATRTGWRSSAVLFDGTLSPVSGQYCVTVWLPWTFGGAGVWAGGLGLDRWLHAVSTRPVAMRADKVGATRRTSTSPSRAGPTVLSSVNDRFSNCEQAIQADREGRAGDLTRLTPTRRRHRT